MNQTTNYQLNQWDPEDRILRTDFNADNSKIDAALKSHANSVSSLSSQMSRKGNCTVTNTTYIGDGTEARTLNFSAKPMLVVVMTTNVMLVAVQGAPAALGRNAGSGGAAPPLTWSGNSIKWGCDPASEVYCNKSGVTYYVTALLST